MITYRQANESDAEALVPIINRAFVMELAYFSTERIDLAETLAHFKKGTFLVAEEDGKLLGCVYVELRGEKCYFGLLAVDPAQQGRGIGAALIDRAESLGRGSGCKLMEIRVLDSRTELPPLYEKIGYTFAYNEQVEQKPSALQPYHFIVMEKDLS